jgi:N-acetylmuramic acid 6-phosphate (MurNAc-6-P) etherase
VEIEYINKVIRTAKKPVMTIKPMAAGRVTPFVGLNFAYATLRDCDMVTVGCFTSQEVHEDVEIAMAFFEHRLPDVEGRNSPNKTSIMV